MAFKVPERYRIKAGAQGTTTRDGNNGAFNVRVRSEDRSLFCIASDGAEWEHVSVSIPYQQRCPSWTVMCEIKELFWGPEDIVVQFHPAANAYVNFHPYCLHLWRKADSNAYVEVPPPWLVGPK